MEGRAAAELTLGEQLSRVSGHDLVAYGETEPRTSRLRGEQRLEHMPALLACHTDAVIRDLDVNVLVRRSDDTEIECAEALRHVSGNAQLARPAVHGVACVQGEVREDLRDLVRV